MILAAYLSSWQALKPGVQWTVGLALGALLVGVHVAYWLTPAPEAQPYSAFGTRVVIRGGK